jgi:UDP-3-O-[3-hydroxymyristoyl] glucosamine N-acyltransferase
MLLEDLQLFLNPILIIKNFESEIRELNLAFDNKFENVSLGWVSDKNVDRISDIHKGNVLISYFLYELKKTDLSQYVNWIIVDNPRKSFADVIEKFFIEKKIFGTIHSSCVISSSSIIDLNLVNIGPNVVIEENVQLGTNVDIGANTVIKKGTYIGSNVTIGSNCTIGGVGFGYEKDNEGNYKLIHHIGNVIINDLVDIGNNVCIDRAVIGSTIIGKNVKIDNLVHVAHGVKINENSLIIANTMLGGSVEIGKNVWVSPSVSIRQKLKIQDNSLIGMGSVVVKDVLESDIVAGVPAKSIKK